MHPSEDPVNPTRPLLTALCLWTAYAIPAGAQDPFISIGQPDSLYSEVLGEMRPFWIHLPEDGLREGVRYPVMYVLDGEVHLQGMAAVLAYYTYSHVPELIVVGVGNAMNRDRDLTVSEISQRNGMAMEVSGGADRFMTFLADELIPYMDRTYPTSTFRTLVGHSYGGLFTIHTLLTRPDLFSTYLAMDPSLDWDYPLMLDRTREALATQDFTGKTLYVTIANEIPRFSDTLTIRDIENDTSGFSLGMRSQLEFVRMMEDDDTSGLRSDWRYYENDLHGSVPLASMRDGLMFAFDWFVLRSPSVYNDPATPTETLVTLIRERGERLTANLGYSMAMEEDLLVMLGYMAMDMMEQPDKAMAIFRLTQEYYPDNEEVRDAIATLEAKQ
ncbi:MAG: alpha/beta hydrolase [Rhodothermales bacterium]|nr:alpha/beta hydrolase [Rhodothermales bacterium]